ncbi:MAG: hypothetical protein LC104_02550 [Bacteroidales bacterium]|nr:hypothetical protein [Bacteroidales bacterium]
MLVTTHSLFRCLLVAAFCALFPLSPLRAGEPPTKVQPPENVLPPIVYVYQNHAYTLNAPTDPSVLEVLAAKAAKGAAAIEPVLSPGRDSVCIGSLFLRVDQPVVARYDLIAKVAARPSSLCIPPFHLHATWLRMNTWRLAHGVAWVHGRFLYNNVIDRLPLDDWNLCEVGTGNHKQIWDRYWQKYPRVKTGILDENKNRLSWSLASSEFQDVYKPIMARCMEMARQRSEKVPPLVRLFHGDPVFSPGGLGDPRKWYRDPYSLISDVLPESATSVLVFARLPYAGLGKRIMAWPVTAKWQTDAKQWTVQDVPDKPVIDMEVPVGDEPIRVFGDRRELFFVTASGKCYSATRGNDQTYQIQTLWADPDRPIVAFVGDADRGRTFAFTQSAGSGGSVYFELRVPVQPAPCPHPVPNLQNVDASILVQLAKIIPGGQEVKPE